MTTQKKRQALTREVVEWTLLSATLALILALCTYFVWSEYDHSMAAEIERMQSQVGMIDENLTHQFGAVRSALESVRTAIQLSPNDWSGAKGKLLLKTLRSSMPGVRAIAVLNKQGNIVVSDDAINDKRLDDVDFIAGIAKMRDDELLYVSSPFENSPGVSNIKLAMVIPAMHGFEGVVVAILNPEYFDVVMRSALYASDMHSAITESGGRRLLFAPVQAKQEVKIDSFPSSFFNRHMRSGENTSILRGPFSMSNDEHLCIQKTIDRSQIKFEKAMVVSLSRSVPRIQQPWRQMAMIYGLIWLALAGSSTFMLNVIQKRRRSYTALSMLHEQEREAQSQRIEMALEAANLGLWDWDIKHGIILTDPGASVLLGHSQQALSMTYEEWRAHIHTEDAGHHDKSVARHIEKSDLTHRIEYRMHRGEDTWIWVQSCGKVVARDAEGKPLRMVGTWMDISERKEVEVAIEKLAFFDSLTDLPNRRLLQDRLKMALSKSTRSKHYGAALFIDIDNFKELNDSLGHHVGDQLLVQVANRLQRETRDTDTVARLGGDEFVVLFEGLGATLSEATYYAESVADKILKSLREAYQLDTQEVFSTPSIGVFIFGGEEQTMDDVVKCADLAMYEAKLQGRNTFCVFNRRMHDDVVRENLLESELRNAIQGDQFELYYQPIVGTDSGLIGVEALIRWQHPERGLIPPSDFIPYAERTGLIVAIGSAVLDKACAQLAAWSKFENTAHLTISVNVSARQFRQQDFVNHVLGVIYKHAIIPSRLKLELTESMLLDDFDGIRNKMDDLKVYGVGFSLDDFGTGYSSLSYLKNLPFDQLKIDRSFISDLPASESNAAIAQAIISLAHVLKLRVVAEGIETAIQRDFLSQNGCDSFQGYLFGRPEPITTLQERFMTAA